MRRHCAPARGSLTQILNESIQFCGRTEVIATEYHSCLHFICGEQRILLSLLCFRAKYLYQLILFDRTLQTRWAPALFTPLRTGRNVSDDTVSAAEKPDYQSRDVNRVKLHTIDACMVE